MQVGICLFHEQPDGSYVSRPFNFYVFPGAKSRRRLVMDASTAHFHRANHMDFNKWVLEGVPYLSQAEYDAEAEAALAEAPGGAAAQPGRRKVALTRDGDKAFIAAALEQLQAWLEQVGPSGEAAELALPACNLSSTYLDCYRPLALERSGRSAEGHGRLEGWRYTHVGV